MYRLLDEKCLSKISEINSLKVLDISQTFGKRPDWNKISSSCLQPLSKLSLTDLNVCHCDLDDDCLNFENNM